MRGSELVVLGRYRSNTEWMALTTERVAWLSQGTRHDVDFAQLVDATVPDEEMVRAGSLGMQGVQWLALETRDGVVSHVDVESGLPLVGVWNVLHWVARRGARQARK